MAPLRFTSIASALLTLFSIRVDSAEIKRLDGVHRVEKTHVTIIHDLVRRDHAVTNCPINHNLCPSSMSGGCCPDRYDCATDSCYATTSATQTCHGNVGYYGCPMELGGACCPVGYICRRDDCAPPEGMSYSMECPTNYFQCPSSLNYGCCRNGMGCAARACYSTEPSTYVITRISTSTLANDDETTITERETTVSTPSAPTGYQTVDSGDDEPQVVVKFYPESVPKVDPEITESDSGGGGLSTGAIVGIVVGVVGLLIIVFVAAWIIIRHLNKVVQVVESKQGTSKDSHGTKDRPAMAQYRISGSKPTPSEIDDMSIDPLMMTSPRPSHRRFDSDSDGVGIGMPSPTLGTPSPNFPGGYQAVPNSAAADRHRSYDSNYQGDAGYFDTLPDRSHRASGQSSAWAANRHSSDSQGTQAPVQGHHGRQWSNASELSTTEPVTSPVWNHNPQELDSTVLTPELHGESLISPVDPMSPDLNDPRRASDGSTISAMTATGVVGATRPVANLPRRRSSEGRSRTEGPASAAVGQGTLSVVAEDTEVIGHYGPSDRAAGQTAVGLNQWGWGQADLRPGPQQ